jgi:hypothetical protein
VSRHTASGYHPLRRHSGRCTYGTEFRFPATTISPPEHLQILGSIWVWDAGEDCVSGEQKKKKKSSAV